MRGWLLIIGGILMTGLALQLIYFTHFDERIGPVGDGSVPLFLYIIMIASSVNGLIALYKGGYLLIQKRRIK
ncbi:hypothetical protein [Jeotgalibacillus terrae]|uniref:Group-specific protein n=1 Tax=Jeotgalibacillus terrae TaxID=587735 RepID=A0ABW5ZFH3_9BACL|nr:hypothetical protein [Jeotgalibacillus terrae]MBM7579390.1 hypothetical protein [Jeotgalibacillus terrae]